MIKYNVKIYFVLQKKTDEQKQETSDSSLLTALTWGHNDQRLFVACTNSLHVLRVYNHIPSIGLLSQLAIKSALVRPTQIDNFCLPDRLRNQLLHCFHSTIKSVYPRISDLRSFVCACLPESERLHCTLKCSPKKSSANSNGGGLEQYTLYLEYLGGLIPLLSARKASKLKPNFVIFDPVSRSSKKEPVAKKTKRNRRKLAVDPRRKKKRNLETSLLSSAIVNNTGMNKIIENFVNFYEIKICLIST
jgi:hypothetical protein